jgi:hypothetical protein
MSISLLLYAGLLSSLVNAQQGCPCGYTTGTATFMESFEADFTTVKEMAELKDYWQVQDWITQKNPSNPNVLVRQAKYGNIVAGDGQGIQLLVKPPVDGVVGTSEMRTARDDFKFGTFRITMKTPKQSGTCAAFFWVRTRI